MADRIQQGPQSTGLQREDRQGPGLDNNLSQLSVSAYFSEKNPPQLPSHTSASVALRWGERSFDTGAVIKGEVVGGKR
jgi:hypothetical protein